MLKQVLERHQLILLTSVMVVLMLIVATLLLYSGTTAPPRPKLDIAANSSSDFPPSTEFLLVRGIDPSSVKVNWKDVKVLYRAPCYTSEGNTQECPAPVTAVKGTDYDVQDKDGDGIVSSGDILVFNINATSSWGYKLSLQWTKTGNIMYETTLPSN